MFWGRNNINTYVFTFLHLVLQSTVYWYSSIVFQIWSLHHSSLLVILWSLNTCMSTRNGWNPENPKFMKIWTKLLSASKTSFGNLSLLDVLSFYDAWYFAPFLSSFNIVYAHHCIFSFYFWPFFISPAKVYCFLGLLEQEKHFWQRHLQQKLEQIL